MKDQAKCDEALATTRQALKAGQTDLMAQWRDRAWKYCEDPAASQGLDKEIVDTQAAELAKKQAEAAEKQKLTQLGQTFASWVGQHRAAPDKASAAPQCPEVEKGKKEEERFCTATRKAGPYDFSVRYWQAEPPAARFTLKPGAVMECSHFGPTSEVRAFNIPAASGGPTAKRTVCQFTGGTLNGMQLVLTNAVNADVHIFSTEYLAKDAGMKPYIGG
ncbi:MAG TPA: hypothetical protein VI197_22495 [Polyangiaceae bacterium]